MVYLLTEELSQLQLSEQHVSTSETAPTGGIRVDLGSTLSIAPGTSYTIPSQLTTPQTFYDYGGVNDLHDHEDYGWILGTIASGMPACIYGQIDIFGSSHNVFTPNWVGSGTTKLSGVAYVPLDAKYRAFGFIRSLGGAAEVVAFSQETTDLFKVQGSADPAFVQQHHGEGTLFGISGVAEAVGFNPVDITTDIRIAGTAGDPTLAYTHVGSGTLFNFLGLVEKASFDYVGSGDIKLHARKPEIYQLSDLAAFTLDDYVVQSNYINLGDINHYDGHTNLRTIRLKYLNLEEGHEKHTEVYDEGLCNDNPEIDYGFLVDSSNIACVDEYGIISSDTNSTTGCTQVTDGEVLSIQPGFKYSSSQVSFLLAMRITELLQILQIHIAIMVSFGIPLDSSVLAEVLELSTEMHSSHSLVQQLEQLNLAELSNYLVMLKTSSLLHITLQDIFQDLVELALLYSVFSLHPKEEHSENLVDLQRLYFGIQIPNNFYSMYLVHVYQYSACRTLDLAHSEFLEKLVLLSQGSTVVLELFQSLVLQQKHLLRILQILQHAKLSGEKENSQRYAGEGSLFAINGSSQLLTFAEQPEVNIRISGISENAFVPNHIGSGSLRKLSGAAESVSFNPDERQILFSFTGESQEAFIANPPEEGTEIILSGSTAPEILTFSEEIFGTISISGESMHSYQTILVLVHSENYLVLQNRSLRIQKRDKCLLLYWRRSEAFVANPPEEGGNSSIWFYSTRNSCVCRRVIWNNCSIWNCWCTLCTILYRIGYIQKTIWCCGIVHCKSRRETDALLVYWRRKRDTHRELCRY